MGGEGGGGGWGDEGSGLTKCLPSNQYLPFFNN